MYNSLEVSVLNNNKKVPIAVIRRLPRYHRYLSELLKNDITRISSKELSKVMGVTASQIRQDLNFFGGFGQQGYGYNVEYLYNEFGEILGLSKGRNMIIVGAGNLGRALANYSNFVNRGFSLISIFDVNPDIIGKEINGIMVRDFLEVEEFIKSNYVDIGILSVPQNQTPNVAEKLAGCGVKALWNFSPMDLKLPYDVVIENVHLSDSLMILSYKLNVLQMKTHQLNADD